MIRVAARGYAEARHGPPLMVLHAQPAVAPGQAAVNHEQLSPHLEPLVLHLRFIQNQLPGRTASAAGLQYHPHRGDEIAAGQKALDLLGRRLADLEHVSSPLPFRPAVRCSRPWSPRPPASAI